MLAGVREAATARWNASHPDQSLGLVALELELSRHGAALLAAPASTGGQRLRVRRVAEGVIELLPRDGVPAGSSSSSGGADSEGAVALAGAGGPQPGAWPLTSVHPSQLQVEPAAFIVACLCVYGLVSAKLWFQLRFTLGLCCLSSSCLRSL
jgi:hypothetical protein